MNRLRKIGQWFWAAKERFVLAIMVLFLGIRIYAVMNPTSEVELKPYSPPRTELAEDVEIPGTPPRTPNFDRDEDWNPLIIRNMFLYEKPKENLGGADNGEASNLRVLRFLESPPGSGNYRVQIQTEAAARKWYSEGDEFETYSLISVDGELKCCELFDERLGKRIELCIE